MQLLRILLLPFAWIYGLITFARNKLYDWGIFKTYIIPGKSICVGNLAIGGTGKTPHVVYLTKLLQDKKKVTILSRGYGRKTKGFIAVNQTSTGSDVGDEPKLYASRFFPKVNITVCEKRTDGVKNILSLYPENEIILLDDAFQHRAVRAGINIIITDYTSIYADDHVIPAGNLREWKSGRRRADWIIVSKSPFDLPQIEKDRISTKLKFDPTKIFFSSIQYGELISFGKTNSEDIKEDIKNVVLVTGIANPKPFVKQLETHYKVEIISFSDHHNFSVSDIERIHQKFDTFATEKKAIITTEKDFMRLSEIMIKTEIKKYPWYYQEIEVKIDKEEIFNNLVYQYVDTI